MGDCTSCEPVWRVRGEGLRGVPVNRSTSVDALKPGVDAQVGIGFEIPSVGGDAAVAAVVGAARHMAEVGVSTARAVVK